MSVLILGSVNTDLVIRSPRLPRPGETVLGGEFYQAAGGKGANQAVAAARVGSAVVTFVAAVGGDGFGREALAGFERDKLDCRFVKVVAGQPSGVALIMVDGGGQNCISVALGANAHLSPTDIDAIPSDVFCGAKVFLACLESPLETVSAGLRRARGAGVTTILNPAPASREILDRGLLSFVDILTPNEREASQLSGIEVVDAASGFRAAQVLRQAGCRDVIVTLGERGCVVAADDETEIRPLPVSAVDATAAGDAFNGALAVAIAEGRSPLASAARWASIAAAISVTRPGAQPSLPTRAEVDGFSLPGDAASRLWR